MKSLSTFITFFGYSKVKRRWPKTLVREALVVMNGANVRDVLPHI
jgi:hypothetical protein